MTTPLNSNATTTTQLRTEIVITCMIVEDDKKTDKALSPEQLKAILKGFKAALVELGYTVENISFD